MDGTHTGTTAAGLDPIALARLGSLPIQARVIVEGALSGLHRARLHGSSVEFSEHKEYSPGDEIRHIDWKAYAKLDRFYVKQFEQESQLTVYLVLDASASMAFQGGGARKLDYAAWFLAAIAHLVIGQQDKVGLVAFGSPSVATVVPARARASHLHALLDAISRITGAGADGDGDAASALDRVAELARRRRALIILASDLFDRAQRVVPTLRRLRAQHHDVAVLHVLDPHERTFPYEGLTRFDALEGEHRLLANPAAIRNTYLERMEGFLAATRAELTAGGIDYLAASTDGALDVAVREFLMSRAHLAGGGKRAAAARSA